MTKLFLQHISPQNYLQQNAPPKTEREAKVFMRPEATERKHHANESVLHKEERPLQRCSGVQGALLLKRGKAQPQAMPGSGCSSARSPLPDCCPWERAAAPAGSGWEKGVRKVVARDQGRGRKGTAAPPAEHSPGPSRGATLRAAFPSGRIDGSRPNGNFVVIFLAGESAGTHFDEHETLFSTCNVLLLNFSNFLRSEAFWTETGGDNGCREGIEMRRFDHGRAGVRA